VRTAGLSMPSWALKCQGLFLSVVPSVLFILGLALLAFTLLGVVRLIVSQLGFLQRMQSCQTVESGDARDILDRLLKTSGIRRKVTLLLIADEIEPGAWGLLSWRIVLPPRALDDLSKTELQALLAHELAHLARGDQWWIWIGHVLTLCIGWQPLNRIAFREWRKSAEYLCDAWAVECNVSRLNLARCLASVAGWRMSTVVRLAGVTGENRSSLSGRVERLIDDCALSDPWRTPGRRQILAAASGFLGVVVVCCAPSAKLFGSPSVAVKQMDVAVANSKSESTREDLPESVEPTAVSSRRRGNSRLASLQENDYPQMAFMPSWQPDRGADEHVERPQAAAPTVNKSPRRKLTRVIFHEVSIQDVLVDLDTLALDLMDLEEMLVQSRTLINSRQAQFKVTHFHVRLLGYVQSREASDQLEL
jgi:beta-lactamase regulating signal transducer with metallopeptidase domain